MLQMNLLGHFQSYRLEARKHDEDWHHESPTGTECWRPVRHLGSGTFGDVSQQQCISPPSSENAVRAVKRISKRQARFSLSSQREIEALITFSDPAVPHYQRHFVQFLGWFEDPTDLHIAMEFIPHGNLQQYIDRGRLPEAEAATITAQVAKALQYMHEKRYIHRDLKPMNILVSRPGPEWHVKVADFGIAKNIDGTAAGTHGIGTPGYMAPELHIAPSQYYTSAVDVWALGAVAFCLVTGSPPFRTTMQLYDYYTKDQSHFPVRELGASSGFCMNFVLGAMAERPERRFTIEQVLAHHWLALFADAAPATDDDVNSAPAMASTWGIEPMNNWSNTYHVDSTIRQSFPAHASRPASVPQPALHRTPMGPPSLPPGARRPEMPRAETTSSTQSRQTVGSLDSLGSGYSTFTSATSPPVSPGNTTKSATGPTWHPTPSEQQQTVVPAFDAEVNSLGASAAGRMSNPYLTCKTCGKTFKKRRYLMEHAKSWKHEPDGTDPYLTCLTCNWSFHSRDALFDHIAEAGHGRDLDTGLEAEEFVRPGTRNRTTVSSKDESPGRHIEAPRSPSPSPPPQRRKQLDPSQACLVCHQSFSSRNDLFRHLRLSGHVRDVGDDATKEAKGDLDRRVKSTRHGEVSRDAKPPSRIDPHLTCLACHRHFSSRDGLFAHLETSGHARDVVTGKPEKLERWR